MKYVRSTTFLLTTFLSLSHSLAADRPAHNYPQHNPRQAAQQPFDYRDILQDPTLIMTLSAEMRREAISCITDYRTFNEHMNAIKTGSEEHQALRLRLTHEERMRKLTAAKESFKFYLDLKLEEEERITALTRQRIEIDEKKTAIFGLLKERQEKSETHHLELDKRIRQEERSVIGWIKDKIVWGRNVAEAPQQAGYQQIRANVEQATLLVLEHLNHCIQQAQNQQETLHILYTQAHERVQALENELN